MILGQIQVKKSWINDWGKAILIPEKIRDRNAKSSASPEAVGSGAQCAPAASLLDPYGTQLHRLDQEIRALSADKNWDSHGLGNAMQQGATQVFSSE
jgi:hypothetical protein